MLSCYRVPLLVLFLLSCYRVIVLSCSAPSPPFTCAVIASVIHATLSNHTLHGSFPLHVPHETISDSQSCYHVTVLSCCCVFFSLSNVESTSIMINSTTKTFWICESFFADVMHTRMYIANQSYTHHVKHSYASSRFFSILAVISSKSKVKTDGEPQQERNRVGNASKRQNWWCLTPLQASELVLVKRVFSRRHFEESGVFLRLS